MRIFGTFYRKDKQFWIIKIHVNLEPEETVPIDPSTLLESKLLISTPRIEEFLPSDQGKRAVYAAAWQNEKGEQGPFSDVQVHIIP
ncbi:hypothetical protein ACYULU_02295 [Breznakiellaceae bacterium SP9]